MLHSPKPSLESFRLGTLAESQLDALCAHPALSGQRETARAMLREMSASFASHRLACGPQWCSDLTDDGTPYEWSLAFEPEGPRLRLLVEAQRTGGHLLDQWREALHLQERLVTKQGQGAARFAAIQDLFRPWSKTGARFALWHAAVFDGSRGPLLKAYLNPRIAAESDAGVRLREALERLGFASAWSALVALGEGSVRDEDLMYFSLDLDDSLHARVKVYVAHPNATPESWARAAGAINPAATNDALQLCEKLAPGVQRFDQRPVLTCVSFTANDSSPKLNLHFPVRCYARDDQAILSAAQLCLNGPDHALLMHAARAVGPFHGRGLITYVSASRLGTAARHTVYLAPRVFEQ